MIFYPLSMMFVSIFNVVINKINYHALSYYERGKLIFSIIYARNTVKHDNEENTVSN